MERRTIEVPRTARYYVRAEPGAVAREVWFLLHGYGQLAAPFLESAGGLARPGRTLVAPEGLSRYYLRRGTGTVGASWMTREERADEIRDTLRYLDRVWGEVRAAEPRARPTALGFSQGGAAAARWAVLGQAPVEHLVSWGCPLPTDLELEAHAERVRALRWTFVLGRLDESIDRAAHAAGLARLRALGVEPAEHEFPGGHELEPGLLGALA
ncbi:MAG TPA: phospholipase [Planctomycetota bacterium]